MHFHWQNLNDHHLRTERKLGGGARHGRAWLHWGGNDPQRYRFGERVLGWEWAFFWRGGSTGIGIDFQRGDGVGIMVHASVWWLFSFYLHVHGGLAARIAGRLLPNQIRDRHTGQFRADYGDREIQVRANDWALWWSFWQDPNEWSSRTPKWRHGSFHLVDFLFGRTKYSDRELAREQVKIPMPERAYDGEVVIEERTWRRPRWPFVWRRLTGATVHCERDPVPHPGKGESAYDCGEDATYSSSTREKTVEAAVAKLVQSTLERRRRYGGRDWRPKEDHRPKAHRAARA